MTNVETSEDDDLFVLLIGDVMDRISVLFWDDSRSVDPSANAAYWLLMPLSSNSKKGVDDFSESKLPKITDNINNKFAL
ncbi:MAG TPA: hypothetical protein VH796_17160 [Nitrososphaeraceae archaeon]